MATVQESIPARWVDFLESEILGMNAEDGCALDCLRVIRAADALLDLCADLEVIDDGAHAVMVREAAAAQCGVFYFG